MKLYKVNKHIVDVFQGEGWKNWSRVHIKTTPKGKRAEVIAGKRLPVIKLIQISKES